MTTGAFDPDRFTIGLTVGTEPPIRRVRAALRAARALRFDVAWTVDHFVGFYPRQIWDRDFSWAADPQRSPHAFFDYQVLLGDLARRAGNVRLGVGVTESIRRHPVLLAQAAMTLAHLTRRAPILGVGAGERENIEPFGLDFGAPVSRLEEALQVIRLCFESSGPFDFAGEHFSMRGATMDLQPPAGRTPLIWVAAHGPRMLRLAGAYGDGWYPTLPMTPDGYAARLAAVRAAASSAGRDPSAVVPAYQAFAVFARTERAGRALLDSRAVRFVALLAPAEMWETYGMEHPFGPGFRGFVDFLPEQRSRAELDAAIGSVPVDLVAEGMIWGTPAEVRRRFADFRDAGLRHLVLQPVSALVSKKDAAFSLLSMARIQRSLQRSRPDQPLP